MADIAIDVTAKQIEDAVHFYEDMVGAGVSADSLTVTDDNGEFYSLKLRLISGKPAIEINQKEADENV